MWNNYTVDMLNPDKIASRQAEAAAERRAAEGRVHAEHATGATAGILRVVVAGRSLVTAALQRAGLAVANLAESPRVAPRIRTAPGLTTHLPARSRPAAVPPDGGHFMSCARRLVSRQGAWRRAADAVHRPAV